MWEMQILNTGKTERLSDSSEVLGGSTGSSQGSLSPQEQATSPTPQAQPHPALRGVVKPVSSTGKAYN